MDVDLSTDLAALLPLVAPLLSGHSDLAIGTRLTRSARVVRGPKRELISRCYNTLLHATLATRFSDAQCGFKAIRADRARELLPLVEDTGWFFDTELLVLAERAGLRIHEVPVDWVDDPDSRVDIVATASADLRGVARLARGLADGSIPVATLRERLGRTARPDPPASRASRRRCCGSSRSACVSTLAYLAAVRRCCGPRCRPGRERRRAAARPRSATPRPTAATRSASAARRGAAAPGARGWPSSAFAPRA